jgi:hypothetical protein
MLTLNGGTTDESPVMGAISDMDPNNAYTIMSYMSIKVGTGMIGGGERVECVIVMDVLYAKRTVLTEDRRSGAAEAATESCRAVCSSLVGQSRPVGRHGA